MGQIQIPLEALSFTENPRVDKKLKRIIQLIENVDYLFWDRLEDALDECAEVIKTETGYKGETC